MPKNVFYIFCFLILISCNSYHAKLDADIYKNEDNNFIFSNDSKMTLIESGSFQPIDLSKIKNTNIYFTFSYYFGCNLENSGHLTRIEKKTSIDNITLLTDNECTQFRSLFSSSYKIVDENMDFDSIVIKLKYDFPNRYSINYSQIQNSLYKNDQKLRLELYMLIDDRFKLFNKRTSDSNEAVIEIFKKGKRVLIKETTDFPGMFSSIARIIDYKFPNND